MVVENEVVLPLPTIPKPMTVITVEEKNMLADETNPTLFKSPSSKSEFPYKNPRLPQKIISTIKTRIDGVDERRLNTFCMPVMLCWVVAASFFAGFLFYRYFSRNEPTFYGMCGTSYLEQGRREKIEQKLEISQDELYEKIQVPRFGLNRPAVFVHDFRKNVTAIVDVLGDRCFIKELDPTIVSPPKSFIDLIEKMENGYYAQNPRVIRETFRVGGKLSIGDLTDIDSPMISRHCIGHDVYLLVRSSKALESPFFVRDKREARDELQFSVMNGDNVEVEKIIF